MHLFLIFCESAFSRCVFPFTLLFKGALSDKIVNFCYPLKLSDMIDALIKRASVTYRNVMKCTCIGEKWCNCLYLEIDQEMAPSY